MSAHDHHGAIQQNIWTFIEGHESCAHADRSRERNHRQDLHLRILPGPRASHYKRTESNTSTIKSAVTACELQSPIELQVPDMSIRWHPRILTDRMYKHERSRMLWKQYNRGSPRKIPRFSFSRIKSARSSGLVLESCPKVPAQQELGSRATGGAMYDLRSDKNRLGEITRY
jgi:hypothetical protein